MQGDDISKAGDSHSAALTLERSVVQLADQGKFKESVAACQRLNREFPEYDAGWHTASHLALQINNPGAALQAIERAVSLAPGNERWRIQQGVCLARLGLDARARSVASELSGRSLPSAELCAALGMLLSQLESHDEAKSQFQRAIDLAPGNGGNYYNLATVQRALGDLTAAESNFSRAIELNASDYEAWYARSELRRQSADDNHIPEIEALLDAGIPSPRGEVQVLYALAKELEDVAQPERSFRALQQGATLRRQHLKYRLQGDLGIMLEIRDHYGADLFDSCVSGSDNREPIFVLGLPRTGTTLVERILGSHSAVHAAGELNNFSRQMVHQAQALLREDNSAAHSLSREQLVAFSARLDFRRLGEAYVKSTRPRTGHTAHFVDKLPLNFLYAGLIHLSLPAAKIIHVQRHPLDTCYAIYKTLFKDAYPFSYDLQELGRYYLAYHALMQHWNSVMPGVIQTVRYEELVADVEEESRRLLAACDLPWEPQCLRFYENSQASTTASASQVREPAYTSSVGKWRHFEKQLQPLIETLDQGGLVLDD